MRVDLSKLYSVNDSWTRGSLRAELSVPIERRIELANGNCAEIALFSQAKSSGSRLHDLLGTNEPGFYLWSKRMQDALTKEAITGWKACPIRFKGKDGKLIKGYNAIGITGRCGPIDVSRRKSEMRISLHSGKTLEWWVGLHFDEDTWDGSDLFRPEGTMFTFATERTKQVLERAKPTNLTIKPISQFEILAH